MKVFISWSGPRSKQVAEALRDWLPDVIQSLEPWMSAEDIGAGSRWSSDIANELDDAKAGIVCVTRDNPNAQWLLFEAGALSRKLKDTALVCPYLLDSDVRLEGPLGQFQAKRANPEDTAALMATLNRTNSTKLSDDKLKEAFERWWPKLERRLSSIPASEVEPNPPPTTDQMIATILKVVKRLEFKWEQEQPQEIPSEVIDSLLKERLSIRNYRNWRTHLPAGIPVGTQLEFDTQIAKTADLLRVFCDQTAKGDTKPAEKKEENEEKE